MNVISKETFDAFRDGDARAFNSIFIAYNKPLKFFISKIVNSSEDAKELTQEVFIKLWESRHLIDTNQNVHQYIYTMARNFSLNFIRSKRINQTYSYDYHTTLPSYSILEEGNMGEYYEIMQAMAIDSLPPKQKAIYLLSNEGLSNQDIADQLRLTKKTVDNSLSASRAIVKKRLQLLSLLIPMFNYFG